jgi:hypothetical protein
VVCDYLLPGIGLTFTANRRPTILRRLFSWLGVME